MSREFVVLRCRRFTGRATRELSKDGLLVYTQLHFQSDLTPVGTIVTNVGRLAIAAKDLDIGDVAKALVELEDAGLILMDSCTQELALVGFCDGIALKNRNHLRGAARAFRCIESETLRARIYEASPPAMRDAIDKILEENRDAIPMGSQSPRDSTPIYVDVDVDEDVDENEDLAVVKAFWQLNGEIRTDEEEQACESRVQEAAVMLARRRVAEQPLNRTLAGSLSDQWGRHGELLRRLASDYPNWSAGEMATAVDGGAFSG